MGNSISRREASSSRQNDGKNQSRRYHFESSQSEGIFGPYYIMGGMKFETTSPQKYLFGTGINDLNYLGPYGIGNEMNLPKLETRKAIRPSQVKPIEVLINLRRSSLRLVRAPSLAPSKEESEKEQWFHVEFTVDCSVAATARIHYLVKETPKGSLVPTSNNSSKSDQLDFEPGIERQFCMLTHRTCPSKILSTENITTGDGWNWNNIPMVIQVKTKDGSQSQLTYCTFEKNTQNNYVIKVIKQRVKIGKLNFCLQEVYGIEQKAPGEEAETECSICWDEPRDTLILPCRHLAVCSECAEKIRYQQAACPICRKPFKALLKIEIRRQVNQVEGAFSEIINKVKNLRLADEPEEEAVEEQQAVENNNSPVSEPKSNSTVSTPVDMKEIQLAEKDPKSELEQSHDSGLSNNPANDQPTRRPSNVSSAKSEGEVASHKTDNLIY